MKQHIIDWVETKNYLKGIVHTVGTVPDPLRIAGFDLDDTLINRSKKGTEWILLATNISVVFEQLVTDKYAIVVFTNQGGMSMNKNFDIADWKKNVENVVSLLFSSIKKKFYFAIYAAKCYDLYRKPNLGMWTLMKNDLTSEFNTTVRISKKSFFCGDAAGRVEPDIYNSKPDFSDTDRKFALNIGIPFYTPDDVFVRNFKIKKIKYELRGFDPANFIESYFCTKKLSFKPRSKELVLMVGLPGSGKSEFVNQYILPHDYVHINQDTCKTKAKCLKLTEQAMKDDSSIVIDNVNLDTVTRAEYVSLGQKYSYEHIRCIVMDTDVELAKHLNNVRHVYSDGTIPKIHYITYRTMQKKYEAPSKKESFDKIDMITNHFDCDKLTNSRWNKIFMQLSESQ